MSEYSHIGHSQRFVARRLPYLGLSNVKCLSSQARNGGRRSAMAYFWTTTRTPRTVPPVLHILSVHCPTLASRRRSVGTRFRTAIPPISPYSQFRVDLQSSAIPTRTSTPRRDRSRTYFS